ncbi:MAG: hypothetical protein Q4F85_00360 [Prevotella sp.]|nr:hypothetical protein [Prevotella sp.]
MKIKSFIIVLTVSGACSAVSAQSLYPGQHKAKAVAGMHQPTPVECFDLSEVRLLPGRVRQNLERDPACGVLEYSPCKIKT